MSNPKIYLKDHWTQVLTLSIMTSFWGLFILSSFEYQSLSWFPWLFASRVSMVVLGLVLIGYVLLSEKTYSNVEALFVTIGSGWQATLGILEPSNQTDFHSYVGVLFILVALLYRGTWKEWCRFYLPVNLVLLLSPLFFKDLSVIGSLGSIVARNSMIFVGLGIGLVVSRIQTLKNEALQINILLKEALKKERDEQAVIISRQAEELSKAKINDAIARMMQMLAHDVRKPFSMLNMGLNMLQDASTLDDARTTIGRFTVEVKRAMAAVNGMIQDVMEVGSKSTKLSSESMPVETILEASLAEVCRIRPKADVSFTYDFNHKHLIQVDAIKTQRIFSNIIENAFQAMKLHGEMWFSSKEVERGGKNFIEFCIGNAGSFIPPEDINQLFDAFFTKGKKGGTGLGLAIAKKIVTAHDGTIRCESSQEKGTEFFFTLPASEEKVGKTSFSFPKTTSEITAFLTPVRPSKSFDNLPGIKNDIYYEEQIVGSGRQNKKKIKVLLIDDESIYLDALKAEIERIERLKEFVDIRLARTSDDAINSARIWWPDVVICDVDMGHGSIDGYELVREMRGFGSESHICIHSNRNSAEDYRAAVEAGADAFFPKPMTRTHLLRFVASANGIF